MYFQHTGNNKHKITLMLVTTLMSLEFCGLNFAVLCIIVALEQPTNLFGLSI